MFTTQNLVISNVIECLILYVLSHLLIGLIGLVINNKLAHHSKSIAQTTQDHQNRPCPSSVPIPEHSFLADPLLKEKLPVMSYKTFLEKTSKSRPSDGVESNDGEISISCLCIVCMDCINSSDLMRANFNCWHAFHRDCLDGWIDQGHGTCPLCRSKLLPIMYQSNNEHLGLDFGGDPWRVERMIYLFGEDYVI